MKKVLIALMLIFSMSATPAFGAPVKNGAKCTKENMTAKVGSTKFTCTRFGSSLLWASKNWVPANYRSSSPTDDAYSYSYSLLLTRSSSTLYRYNYDDVFASNGFALRSRALNWCDSYFVTPDFFNMYYDMTSYELNQAVYGCADAVMRRDG